MDKTAWSLFLSNYTPKPQDKKNKTQSINNNDSLNSSSSFDMDEQPENNIPTQFQDESTSSDFDQNHNLTKEQINSYLSKRQEFYPSQQRRQLKFQARALLLQHANYELDPGEFPDGEQPNQPNLSVPPAKKLKVMKNQPSKICRAFVTTGTCKKLPNCHLIHDSFHQNRYSMILESLKNEQMKKPSEILLETHLAQDYLLKRKSLLLQSIRWLVESGVFQHIQPINSVIIHAESESESSSDEIEDEDV